MCHCFSVLLRYSPPVTFHPTNFYVIHNQFHKQDFKNYLLFWYILETRDMNCKKTKMKRFHCLQGAAIKSKCFPVSRLYIILYDSRTNHKLDVLVRWSTLYGAYNWNKYHEVFQISIHYHSTKWHIRLMSKSYRKIWKCILKKMISKRNNISKAASLLAFNAFETQTKSPISRYRRFKLYFMLANLDMTFRYDFEKVLWSG